MNKKTNDTLLSFLLLSLSFGFIYFFWAIPEDMKEGIYPKINKNKEEIQLKLDDINKSISNLDKKIDMVSSRIKFSTR